MLIVESFLFRQDRWQKAQRCGGDSNTNSLLRVRRNLRPKNKSKQRQSESCRIFSVHFSILMKKPS